MSLAPAFISLNLKGRIIMTRAVIMPQTLFCNAILLEPIIDCDKPEGSRGLKGDNKKINNERLNCLRLHHKISKKQNLFHNSQIFLNP